MDFLDPKKRQAHRRRLIIGYILMAVAILTATFILVEITKGYGFDRKKGQIIQNGLVFVSAHPESATMYINGQDKGSTDGRLVLEEGKYTLQLKRDGYRTWSRDFTLDGGSIERFIYPFLFPTHLVSQDAQTYDAQPDFTTESPDRHWIIIHQPTSFNTFTIFDTTKKQDAATTITVPSTILAAHSNQVLSVVEWSTDNRHVLIKDSYDGGSLFLMLDRQDGPSSINVNDTLGRSFGQVALHNKRYDQLYVYDNGLLETADLKSKALNIVAQHVATFWPYSDTTLLYATTDGAPSGKALIEFAQDSKTYTLRTVPASPTYMLNIAEFSNHTYVVAGDSTESRAYVYEDPLDALQKGGSVVPTVKALLKTPGGDTVSFSDNARFIALQGGSTFAIYDSEENRQYRYDTKLTIDPGEKAQWMDGHRLNLVAGGKLYVFDFDGTNMQELNAALTGTMPMFDQGYTAMFTESPSLSAGGKTALVRTSLLANQ